MKRIKLDPVIEKFRKSNHLKQNSKWKLKKDKIFKLYEQTPGIKVEFHMEINFRGKFKWDKKNPRREKDKSKNSRKRTGKGLKLSVVL